ncbi:hypothetical protein PENTCL1PPCAC_60, partial [Pristionchus entomophagus]
KRSQDGHCSHTQGMGSIRSPHRYHALGLLQDSGQSLARATTRATGALLHALAEECSARTQGLRSAGRPQQTRRKTRMMIYY